MSNTGHKNISRYHSKRFGSLLQVRVQWRKEILRRNFYYSNFDSPAETLLAALNCRDEMEIEFGKPRTERRISSKTGVYRSKCAWVAQCSPDWGEVVRKFFSIKKLGEDGARQAALVERRRMEKEYYGGIFSE